MYAQLKEGPSEYVPINGLLITLRDVEKGSKCHIRITKDCATEERAEIYEVKTAHLEVNSDKMVFGRLVAGKYNLSRMEEAVQVSHAILPLVRQQPGFIGVFLFVKPSGDNFSISIWDKEANSRFNIDSGWWMEQVRKFDDIYDGAPITTIHDLIIKGRL